VWDFDADELRYLKQKETEMKSIAILLVLITVIIAGGCGKESQEERKAVEQPRQLIEVVATTGMIADMVKTVGGHFVNVTTVMGPNVDPHTYKASKEEIDLMVNADVVFYNGLGLESEMTAVLERMRSDVRTVALAEGLDSTMLIKTEGQNGAYDPHVWFDVRLWMSVVEQVRDVLAEMDRRHAEVFFGDAEAYMDRLAELHDFVYGEASILPVERKVLITAHRAFNYFGRAYGFDVRALQGINTREGAPDIDNIVRIITTYKVPVVFAEKSVSREGIEAVKAAVAKQGYEIEIGELYSDATGDPKMPQGTYIGMVQHNIQTIVLAMSGERQGIVP
jgi:manganese/zinc/iron transport system substrate-binding protein